MPLVPRDCSRQISRDRVQPRIVKSQLDVIDAHCAFANGAFSDAEQQREALLIVASLQEREAECADEATTCAIFFF